PAPHDHPHYPAPPNTKNRHPPFACHSPSQQRLPCSRRPDQQDTLRDLAAEFREFFWSFQKLDHFPEFLLRLVNARHVGEGHLDILLHIDLGLGLPHPHEATLSLAQPLKNEVPDPNEHHA